VFPAVYVSMVRAGETGAALNNVLSRAAEFLRRAEALRQTVVSALIYPAILAAVALFSVVMVLTVVLPQFTPMFETAGKSLPVSTEIVMTAGGVLRAGWWAILLGLASLAIAWQHAMQRPGIALRRDGVTLHVPLLGGLVTKFEVGRFSRTFGVLRANGVPAPAALALCGRIVGNRAIADAIEVVATRFKEGEDLSVALARTKRFPVLATQLVRLGEETGKLEEMLEQVADIYDQDVQRGLERLVAVLVPGMTIVMGAIIGFVVFSVMSALISINNLAS